MSHFWTWTNMRAMTYYEPIVMMLGLMFSLDIILICVGFHSDNKMFQ